MANDPKRPIIEIDMGGYSSGTTVHVNGEDITRCINGIMIELAAGGVTKVTLSMIPLSDFRARVKGAVDLELV